VLFPVPEFDLAVEDLQLVEVTVTGYVVRVDSNVNGLQQGFVYFRGMARRYDADTSNPGLTVLSQDTSLQWNPVGGLGTLPPGLATAFNISDNTLQILLDSGIGEWRWDLECEQCVHDQLVNLVLA